MTVNSPQNKLDKLATRYYEKSVDAYHAYMGAYTDAESDDEAPDRLIEELKTAILKWHKTQLASLLTELEAKAPKDIHVEDANHAIYLVNRVENWRDTVDANNREWRAAIAALRREHGL